MQAVKQNYKIFGEQRRSIERLHNTSPQRGENSPRLRALLDMSKEEAEGLSSRNRDGPQTFGKRGGSLKPQSYTTRPMPLRAQPSPDSERDRFYKTFQRKFDAKRMHTFDNSQEEFRKGGSINSMMFRD